MKTIILSAAILFLSIANAQNTKPIKAKLHKATVYLQGAHLYYQENILLNKGINTLIFENISPNINDNSLQAYSKDATVMEVRHEIKYPEAPVLSKKIDVEMGQITDSIEELRYVETNIKNKTLVLANEKSLLLNNKLMKGEVFNDSLNLLSNTLTYFKEKLNSILEQELNWQKLLAKNTKKINQLNERYQLLVNKLNNQVELTNQEPTQQVIVSIYASEDTKTNLFFNYLISTASWVPHYDLQATSANNQLQLKYFARISQTSGLDWTNTPITLSTSNPSETNSKPELSPWHLSFFNHVQRPVINYLSSELKPEIARSAKSKQESMNDDEKDRLSEYIQTNTNLIRTEYEIKLNYQIASNGKAHQVLINQANIPMQLAFAAVPKLSVDAFLQAKITNWEDLNIIPGNARLYFDNSYLGEMYLNTFSTNDTLSVNLGRDKSIAISRKKIKEKYRVRMVDNEKIETHSIEMTVKNTKAEGIEITLEDQIPIVINNNEIKVNLITSNGAELDTITGKLSWKLKLNAKESKKLIFTYEIRYPNDKPIAGL